MIKEYTTEDIEHLLDVYNVEEILDIAGVSRTAMVFYLFNHTDILDDFPEDLWPC